MKTRRHSRVVVVSGPSGAGKSTMIRGALERMSDLRLAVSFTTRSPRDGEQDGTDYHFIDRERFRAKIDRGEFLEWAQVFDNWYGTGGDELERILESGSHALLDVDVQGAMNIQSSTQGATFIFIMPPSMDELAIRLRSRGTESEESLQKRLAKAEFEAGHVDAYDHTIINDFADRAIDEMVEIIRAEEKFPIPFRRITETEPQSDDLPDGVEESQTVRTVTRRLGTNLRDEMITLINSHVNKRLTRDLDRLILDTFRDYTRRNS